MIKVDAFLRLQPINSDSDDDSIEDSDAGSSDYDGSNDDGFYEKLEPKQRYSSFPQTIWCMIRFLAVSGRPL